MARSRHAVMDIGFDDKMKIKNRYGGVETNGAFLIRKSWRKGWGKGCVWQTRVHLKNKEKV